MMRLRQFSVLLAAVAGISATVPQGWSAQRSDSGDYLVYVGTYTRNLSKGIYAYRFHASTGKVDEIGLAAEMVNPSFLTVHPNHRYLYAVSEFGGNKGQRTGSVSAFSIDAKTAKLTLLNTVSSKGGGPCYVTVDDTGKYVLIANYNTGSVAAFAIQPNGGLGEATAFIQHTGSGTNPKRQRGPHAHCIVMSPDNRFAVAADLGLDKLLIYRFDPSDGSLKPNDPAFGKVHAGAGPRHFTFHPNGKFAYVINEMGSSVTAFTWDKNGGVLHEIQDISTLPKDFHGQNDDAEIQVHPSGKFLYGSNRGNDSIAVFDVNTKTGKLTPVEYPSTKGKTPRNFRVDPSGRYLLAANQDSDNIVVFRIDQKTGKLTPTGQELQVGAPVCIEFMPAQ